MLYLTDYKTSIIQILIEGVSSSLLAVIDSVAHDTPVIVIDVSTQHKISSDENNVYYHQHRAQVELLTLLQKFIIFCIAIKQHTFNQMAIIHICIFSEFSFKD